MKFRDRVQAGELLAQKLSSYANQKDVIVLALPRGGVPVGFEIARSLNVPLDVFIVRKLGVPWHEELAFGAIAMGNVTVFNDEILRSLNITPQTIEHVKKQEMAELERRNALYRENRPFPDLKDKTVILVDDGIATGATIRAGIAALKKMKCSHIVVAVPVAAPPEIEEIAAQVDKVYCLHKPESLYAISLWYEDFSQTTDEEVRELLAQSHSKRH